MSALPLPAPIPESNRKKASIAPVSDGAEAAEVLVQGLNGVEGEIVVLHCSLIFRFTDLYAEYLIARLLNLGAVRVEFAGCRDEHWPRFAAAAERLGVAERVHRVGLTRLFGARTS